MKQAGEKHKPSMFFFELKFNKCFPRGPSGVDYWHSKIGDRVVSITQVLPDI